MLIFTVLDFFFNCIVERKKDGLLIKSLIDSILIYAKSWMIVDLMAIAGMIENNNHKKIFNNF